MKGMIEEYGGVALAAIMGLILFSFFVGTTALPNGEFHRLAVSIFEGTGAKSLVVLNEWDEGSIHIELSDTGTLYISGSGTLPAYGSIEDTPWAEEVGNIKDVEIASGVIVSGELPIK